MYHVFLAVFTKGRFISYLLFFITEMHIMLRIYYIISETSLSLKKNDSLEINKSIKMLWNIHDNIQIKVVDIINLYI